MPKRTSLVLNGISRFARLVNYGVGEAKQFVTDEIKGGLEDFVTNNIGTSQEVATFIEHKAAEARAAVTDVKRFASGVASDVEKEARGAAKAVSNFFSELFRRRRIRGSAGDRGYDQPRVHSMAGVGVTPASAAASRRARRDGDDDDDKPEAGSDAAFALQFFKSCISGCGRFPSRPVGVQVEVKAMLVLDLGGDGVTIVPQQFSTAFFNFRIGDDRRVLSSGSWLGAQDAFLALDRDGNGRIDGIGELFGAVGSQTG